MKNNALREIAKTLVQPGKGILAADESTETATKRLESIGVASTDETRRQYRELFFGADNIEKYISGVIFFDETIRQDSNKGIPYAQLLRQKGIVPGVKVDQGKEIDPNSTEETVTIGLIDLPERLKEYHQMGARFAKWRAVIKIKDQTLPTKQNILLESKRLAQYAKMCQEAGLVPVVEPEVLKDGTHTIDKAREVTILTLKTVFAELENVGVDLGATILKTSMVIPGSEQIKALPEIVAQETMEVLKMCVPEKLAGIVFLSGGQDAIEATQNLNAIAKLGSQSWPITFSYARALQQPSLNAWQGKQENVEQARILFLHRLLMNSLASKGEYTDDLEKSP